MTMMMHTPSLSGVTTSQNLSHMAARVARGPRVVDMKDITTVIRVVKEARVVTTTSPSPNQNTTGQNQNHGGDGTNSTRN